MRSRRPRTQKSISGIYGRPVSVSRIDGFTLRVLFEGDETFSGTYADRSATGAD